MDAKEVKEGITRIADDPTFAPVLEFMIAEEEFLEVLVNDNSLIQARLIEKLMKLGGISFMAGMKYASDNFKAALKDEQKLMVLLNATDDTEVGQILIETTDKENKDVNT